MFHRKPRTPIDVTRLSSLIAAGVEIAGDIRITDGLRIDGQVEGNVFCKDSAHGLLVLSEKGSIIGSAKVYDAVVNGTIRGDLEVEHYLELQAGARITGNIRYHQLQMECGATVDGTLESLADGTGTHTIPVSNVVSLPRVQAVAGGDHDNGS